ncbi:hypothetical protein D9M70_552760 [compost metagenome]
MIWLAKPVFFMAHQVTLPVSLQDFALPADTIRLPGDSSFVDLEEKKSGATLSMIPVMADFRSRFSLKASAVPWTMP